MAISIAGRQAAAINDMNTTGAGHNAVRVWHGRQGEGMHLA